MTFLIDNPGLLWFLLAVVLFVMEDMAATFFLIFFAVGAVAASILTFILPIGWEAQLLIFIAVSLGSLLLLRRKMRSFFNGYLAKSDNLDDPVVSGRYLDREVVVLQDITSQNPGQVELDGTNWQAKSREHAFSSGERVRVVAVEGLTLVVESLKNK